MVTFTIDAASSADDDSAPATNTSATGVNTSTPPPPPPPPPPPGPSNGLPERSSSTSPQKEITNSFDPPKGPNTNANINTDKTVAVSSTIAIRPAIHPAVSALRRSGRATRYQDPLSQLNDAQGLRDVARICISLSGLPSNISTREIYSSLTIHGLNMTRIEICERQDVRTGIAFVDIEPAPSRWPPWNGPHNVCEIIRPDSTSFKAHVNVRSTHRFDLTTRTPLNHIVPRQVPFSCREMLFGMMAREDAMFKLPQYEYRDVCLEFQFYRRHIQLTFNVDLGRWGVKFYKLLIDFSHIKKITRVQNKDGCAVIIQLPSPPKLFARMPNVENTHDDGLSIWQERDAWQRQVEITDQPHRAKAFPAQLTKNRKTVDLARWTTYYLDMPASGNGALVKTGKLLEDYNVNIGGMDKFDLVEPGEPVWKLINIDRAATMSYDWFNAIHLPFEVRYQLEVCISQGLFNEYSLDQDFLTKLLIDGSGVPREFDRVRMMLEGVADQNTPYYRPADIFEDPKILHYWPNTKLSSQAAMVRRAVVTPTGIYFKTPGVELTNRILRKYSDLTDRFLRVQFTDELSAGKIWSCQGSKQSDEVYLRVLRVLLNGIVIGDRHYKILAWSNSQFREHGAFFFCANDHVSCDDIREWMGDLKHIRSVGKFAARMGQCFTTTRQLTGISVPKIVELKDIERETDGHVWNFTDGVGKISPFFAQMIAHEQNMLDTPCCFQFRMGGCKGVLVVWRDVHASEVHIRPSQEKFKAPYNGLEIIKTSTFSQATLNRQIIPILSCLGVEDGLFMALLEEELEEYEDAMKHSYKASALLRQRVDENQTSLVLADMVDTFMDTQEPFLWTILRLWKCWVLQRLKYKAAISVQKSAMLFGCVDETGALRGHSKETEGRGVQDRASLPQIFLQVPKEGTDPNNELNYHVVTGLCIVGRNPSLHPGDIRVVEAVDVPELRHLKNVVVFPQTGDRDVPSMCSGGDLDGDDFFVFWDERLLPTEWDYPPMNHDAPSPASGAAKDQDVNINDMCAFFAQYMKNDCVGLVATAHFAWADKLGPKSDKCLELANLHSMAVDYIKSGRAAVMRRNLSIKDAPHWMERKGKSYKSNKPVGLIYDRTHVEEFKPAYKMPFDRRILKRFEHTAEELAQAKAIKARYDTAMRRLMGQHERPVSEFEMWSTFILTKPRVGGDYKLQEQVGRDMSALKDRYRLQCGEAVTGVTPKSSLFSYSGIDLQKLDRFVAAMYKVTHEEVQEALEAQAAPLLDEDGDKLADNQGDDYPMPLISFPWLFHMELARIALGGVPPALWQPKSKLPKEENAENETKLASLLNGKVIGKKEGAKVEAQDGGEDAVEDVVRTASGKVVHRGEILELFNEKKEATEEELPSADKSLETTVEVEEGAKADNGIEKVEVDIKATTEYDDLEEESEEEDSDDDLEERARKLVAGASG